MQPVGGELDVFITLQILRRGFTSTSGQRQGVDHLIGHGIGQVVSANA
jgi:hypothetical protein